MEQLKPDTDSIISSVGLKVAAEELGCSHREVQIMVVEGGYSRNRRSLVGHGDKWIFAKEVDHSLIPSDGAEEMGWLRKDFECTDVLRQIVPEIVPDWEKLVANDHVLLMPSYRIEDGWVWSLPTATVEQQKYIQAVVDATKKLESVKFDQVTIDNLKLHPFFRDHLAMDNGLGLIVQNDDIRNQLLDKYAMMEQDDSLIGLRPAIHKMRILLQDETALKDLSQRATLLIEQPNDCFGHCDVRSDNIAYNSSTDQIKFVDWNWASFTSSGFGSTEFLVDMARQGVDITPWLDNLNIEMLAAMVGFYAKRCLKDPLTPGNTLRDMQAQSAAVALNLYEMVAER
jgi:hypothetical protein